MDNLPLWKNRLPLSVNVKFRDVMACLVLYKSLFNNDIFQISGLILFACQVDTLGISLRMNEEPTENHQTNNNIIFLFFIYLLGKREAKRVIHP